MQSCDLPFLQEAGVSPEGQGAVLGVGLAEPHKVAAFLAEQEEVFGICPAQRAMKPSGVWGQMSQEGRPPFKHTTGSGTGTAG